MVDLLMPITRIRSVGARSAAKLEKLGLHTVRHLLWHVPSRYEDFRQSMPISQVEPKQTVSIQGRVRSVTTRTIWPRRMHITNVIVEDESGAIRAVWFNQPYLEDALPEGTLLSVSGKAVLDKRGLYLSNPVYEKTGATLRHTGRLVPIYPETEGVTSKYLRYLIQPLLESVEIPDPLPEAIRREYGLIDLATALRTVHYPDSLEMVPAARARLAFDDLLLLQLKALSERRVMNVQRSPGIPMDTAYMRTCIAELPFPLTKDQRVATLEILRDMERAFPMNRLLEGDVGSGKTVVALLAAFHAARAGWQTLILAPTEVLAQQHHRTLMALTARIPELHTGYIAGSGAAIDGSPSTKASVKKAISSGVLQIVVGTHALLQDDVRALRLGLVVVDEQHRFGIAQRAALMRSSEHRAFVPHLLSMTATPIPRTLALTVFGDLDISIIKEKPKGRQAIITKVVTAEQRPKVYTFMREQVRAGRQIFVICPRIEVSSDPLHESSTPGGAPRQKTLQPLWADVRAVTEEFKRLSKDVFPDLKVAMLHGRMKAKEKDQIMREFKDGWHDILVSTSVIEVGIDIPNATIMMIEGADRFGLAQLHQFRGRVGRGEYQSYCFLCATDDSAEQRRLTVLAKTEDGFELAEADLKLRGPGEFFGMKQSGVSDLAMAALADPLLIRNARLLARRIMKSDVALQQYPILKQCLENFASLAHSE